MKNYNDIIRELREDNDLTQEQVAKVLGIKQQVYFRYELGIIELPIRLLIKLCKFYIVSADYILCLKKDKNSHLKNQLFDHNLWIDHIIYL